jgi:hypothetical protein
MNTTTNTNPNANPDMAQVAREAAAIASAAALLLAAERVLDDELDDSRERYATASAAAAAARAAEELLKHARCMLHRVTDAGNAADIEALRLGLLGQRLPDWQDRRPAEWDAERAVLDLADMVEAEAERVAANR